MFCFGNFCLICVNNTTNLTNLDVNILLSGEKISLVQILMEINAELLNFNEIHPKFICIPCKKDLLTTYAFHKRCRKSIDNLNNYVIKLNHLRLPSKNQSNNAKKTYSFGYNAITSRHMLFKIKKLTKHNFKTRNSKIISVTDVRSNLSTIESNYSQSISDKSTVILEKTRKFNLANTIDKLAKYLNITDLEELDQNSLDQSILDTQTLDQNVPDTENLDQNVLDQNSLDTVAQDKASAIINQKFAQIIETTAQNLNQSDLIDLDQQFYETFNVTDDYFVKEENALDLGSCDYSDISSDSLKIVKNEIKAEEIKNESDTEVQSTSTIISSAKSSKATTRSSSKSISSSSKSSTIIDLISNNNYIDLTASPKPSSVLHDSSNSSVRSESIRTQNYIDLTESPVKSSNIHDLEQNDVGELSNHSQSDVTNLDSKLTGSNYSLKECYYEDISNSNSPSSPRDEILELDNLEPRNLDLNQSQSQLDITDKLIDETNDKSPSNNLDQTELDSSLDQSNHSINNSDESEINSLEEVTRSVLEPSNLELNTSLLNQSNIDNSVELELKHESSEENGRISVQDYVFPEFILEDLNTPSGSKTSELDIEEHPLKLDPDLMEDIKLEVDEILRNHENQAVQTNKRKLDQDVPKNSPKRSKKMSPLDKVPDLASFSSKIIQKAQLLLSNKDVNNSSKILEPNDPNKLQEPNDPNKLEPNDPKLKIGPKVPDLASLDSKNIKNVQLVTSKDVNDPKLKEPNDPNSQTSSKTNIYTISPTRTNCATTLVSTNVSDPNLEPDAPNDPNLNPKLPKSPPKYIYRGNLIYCNIESTPFSHKNAQEPNDPNLRVPTIVPKINVPKCPTPVGEEPLFLFPTNTNDPSLKSAKSPDKKVLIKIKSFKKPPILNPKDPNFEELELFDFDDPKMKTVDSTPQTSPKMCHKEDIPKNVGPKNTILDLEGSKPNKTEPNDPKIRDLQSNKNSKQVLHENKLSNLKPKKIDLKDPKAVKNEPNDPKTKDLISNSKLKPDLHDRNLSPKKKDLKDPKLFERDPNDPKLLNLDSKPTKAKILDVDLSPKRLGKRRSSSVCNDPKNLEPKDPKIRKEDPTTPESKKVVVDKYVSPRKIDLKETSSKISKVLNLVPNDPRLKIYVPKIRGDNQIEDMSQKSLDYDPITPDLDLVDPKTNKLAPKDPKGPNLISEVLKSNKQLPLEIIDPIISSQENEGPNDPNLGPNDPNLGPTDPDAINIDITNKVTNETNNGTKTIPEKSNDPISNFDENDPNPSTSNVDAVFAPHTCRFCRKAYETGFQLKTHIFEVHKDQFNECWKCKMTFSKRRQLLRHLEMYHSNASNVFQNYVPDLRDLNFRNNFAPRPFECTPRFRYDYFRPGGGYRNNDFRARRFSPYTCEMCSRTFFSPFNLNKHYCLEHYR